MLMRRSIRIAIWVVILTEPVAFYLFWHDPINRLQLDLLNPTGLSGMGVLVKLPETASAQDVIAQSSQVHQFQILETRKIDVFHRIAVWIDSDRGEKLVLLRYDSMGWFVQVREP